MNEEGMRRAALSLEPGLELGERLVTICTNNAYIHVLAFELDKAAQIFTKK